MNRNRLARAMAANAAVLSGLALFFACLRAVSAQAQAAGITDQAVAQIWHVDNNPGEGLVGYWKFDQVSGTTTLNSAALNNPTTLVNGASLTTGVPASVTVPDFDALRLDGVNDAAQVADAAALDVPANAFSVAAWVRRVVTSTHTADLIYDSGTQTGHWFFGFLANDKLSFTTNGLVDYSSPLTVTDSNWHHVAAVVNGSGANNLAIYLDGAAAPALSAVITSTPSGPKLIGNKNGSLNTPFSGDIDELRVYNRPLSAAEVGRLAAGRGCVTDGTTWPTAFGDLQCALSAAQTSDQIWVAAGTYRPGANRQASYRFFQSVSLLGGFSGGETSAAQRPPFDPNAPLTALSGDAAGDDVPAAFGNYGDNICGVVAAGSTIILGNPISLTLDGLAIEDGNANCPGPLGITDGGGLANFSANQLSFNNVVFQANRASISGGGLSSHGARLTLSATTFLSNTALDGGGLSSFGPVTATNSTFSGNSAIQQGGGMIISGTLLGANLTFVNNTATPAVGFGGGLYLVAGSANLTGAAFISNTAGQLGGGLYTEEGALTLTNPSFISNTALQDGGGLFNRVAAVINGGTFSHNRASLDGGAIANKLAGSLAVTGAQFALNQADNGGAIFTNFPLSLNNSQFLTNAVGADGGAVAVEAGGQFPVTITGGSFSGNQAGLGGALYVQAQMGALDLSVSQVTFSNNTAHHGPGGAIENVSSGLGIVRSHLSHVIFTGNLSNGDGGAILDDGGLLTIADSQFTGNSTQIGAGGALAAQNAITVTTSTFTSNTALSAGGAVSVIGMLVMSGSSVIQNKAQNFINPTSNFALVGGGVFVSGTAATTNTQFLSNTAFLASFLTDNLAGGGGLAISGTLALTGGDFRGNSAEHGGGLQVQGSASIQDSLFQGNIAEHGGGLQAQGSASIQDSLFQGNNAGSGGGVFAEGSLALLNSRLINNTALELSIVSSSRGGGLFLQNGLNPVLVVNNLFLDNQALTGGISVPHGSAMALGGMATTVDNNTIVSRNLITVSAASVFTGSAAFYNNIITSNTVALENQGGLLLIEDYNLFSGDTLTATGSISPGGHSRVADPRFVAPGQNDFRLRIDSPAVDAGDNNFVPNFVAIDLNGGPRFVDVPSVPDTGAGTPPIVDIGAFEVNNNLFLPLIRQ